MYQDTDVCLYCKAPLKVVSDRKKKQIRLVVQIAAILILGIWGFLTFSRSFRPGRSDTSKSVSDEKPQQIHVPKIEATSPGTRDVTGSPVAAFNDLMSAIARSDAATARKYVLREKLKSYRSDAEMLSDLNALSTHDAKIVSSKVKEGKAVLVVHAEANGITDASGKVAPVIGTIKMIAQDGGWKLFRQMWDINPTTDPVPEAMSWLDSEPSSGTGSQQAAKSALEARGIEFDVDHFQFAVAKGETDLVMLFLQAGMSPNVRMANNEAMTMFQLALLSLHEGKSPYSDIVIAMVKAGANLNARRPTGMTPLMEAAIACQNTVVDSMIQARADVNAKDNWGNTAIFYSRNCSGMEQILKRSGAN